MPRRFVEPLALSALGAAALFVGASFSLGLLVVALAGAAVVSGLVEAAHVRRTGRRRWVMAWLPAVLGMAALAVGATLAGPRGPDSGVADSILVAAFLVGTVVFALATHAVASVVLRPGPTREGRP